MLSMRLTVGRLYPLPPQAAPSLARAWAEAPGTYSGTYSALRKKNSLSLTMGPLSVSPVTLFNVLLLGSSTLPRCLPLSKLLV